MSFRQLYCGAFLLFSNLIFALSVNSRESESTFSSINSNLLWGPCEGPQRIGIPFECVTLTVPLDYNDHRKGNATLPLIQIRASPGKGQQYRGPIVFNPGGPGESGKRFIKSEGERLYSLLGTEYDIVSFDPRGVGDATPQVSFFNTAAERAMWTNRGIIPSLNASDDSLKNEWARAQVLGDLGKARNGDSLRYLRTELVARDMLEIMKFYGREKLQYWGISYGTVLGATFAAMFPDKVERMVLDGVMDADEYYNTSWSTNIRDADKALDIFFVQCAEAGPEACAFHSSTPEAIAARFQSLLDHIRSIPLPVSYKSTDRKNKAQLIYGIVDFSMVRYVVFRALYNPFQTFKSLAKALRDLENGDGSTILDMSNHRPFECSCDKQSRVGAHRIPIDRSEPGTAIMCSDGLPVQGGIREVQIHYSHLSRHSHWADIWENMHLSCSGWKVHPEKQFNGPFVGNTSHPILFIGNTADCATPLRSAQKMAEAFPGSRVLIQNSVGHGSLSATSSCTSRYIRRYFDHGTLPEMNTRCEVDANPFHDQGYQLTDGDRGENKLVIQL